MALARSAKFVIASVFALSFVSLAQAAVIPTVPFAPVQSELDWQAKWGQINFSSTNDPLIPSVQHQAKYDIENAVTSCGDTQRDLSLIKAYNVDLDSDGFPDIVTDASAFFTVHSNGCATKICTVDDGCYLSIYRATTPTNILTPPPTGGVVEACPAKADDNKKCLTYCAATLGNCPGLFEYNMAATYNARVLGWSFISAADFVSFTKDKTIYNKANNNPVLVVQMNSKICYNDELLANRGVCRKYYQYDPVSGVFVDLYDYVNTVEGEYINVFNYTPVPSLAPFPYNRDTMVKGRNDPNVIQGDKGSGLALSPATKAATGELVPGIIAVQFYDVHMSGQAGSPKYCWPVNGKTFCVYTIANSTTNKYFVPTATDPEFSAFINTMLETGGDKVCVSEGSIQFTEWVGDQECPSDIPSGQTRSIAAERYCQRSTGAFAACAECVKAKVAEDYEKGCMMKKTCGGTQCVVNSNQYITAAGLDSYVGKTESLENCYNKTDFWNKYFVWHGNDYSKEKCDQYFYSICRSGTDCMTATARIQTPGGALKALGEIKAGDEVMAFSHKSNALFPSKVKEVAMTKEQPTIRINDSLIFTKNQVVKLYRGGWRSVQDLKVGDILMQADKNGLVVKSLASGVEVNDVINLRLEKGEGFIADGLRVMALPKK